jgi:WD40 repeat protein
VATAISLLLGIVVAITFAIEKSLDVERLRDANLKIGKKQEDTDAALAEARKNLLRAADFAHSQGISLCQQGDVGHGLLWFAHSLQLTPTDVMDRQRTIRRQIAFWRRELHACKMILRHESMVWAVAYSPDGKKVLTGSEGKTARLWDAATGKPIGNPLYRDDSGRCAYSPDGKTVLTRSGHTARLWDAATGKPIGTQLRHEDSVESAAFSPDGKTVLTRGADETAKVWDAATGKPIGNPLRHLHPSYELDAAFSPDGEMILTNNKLVRGSHGVGWFYHTLQLWESATGKPIGPSLTLDGQIFVKFSKDGKHVLADTNKMVCSWQIPEPVPGSAERIELWVQVITGKELSESGRTGNLASTTWLARRAQLQALGGAPLP